VALPETNLQLTKVPDVETGMLIRRSAGPVFEALTDPAITTKFWFTKSTGPLKPDARVQWSWEMYDVTVPVVVKEFESNRRVVVEWGEASAATTIEFDLDPHDDETTFLSIKETGFTADSGDALVARATGSVGGFTQLLAALKAYLEHDIILTVVADRFPTKKHD
jgi:uncharacterized protein YndB with AHSA1/START domain